VSGSLVRWRPAFFSTDKLPPECRSVNRRKLTQMEARERDPIVRLLQNNRGDRPEAARGLGLSRATIYRQINHYGIA
jgi:transcriptional regulator of acetoin/glycerol metabolism